MLKKGRHAGQKGNWGQFLRDHTEKCHRWRLDRMASELRGGQSPALELQSQALTLHQDLTHLRLDLLRPVQLHTHREQYPLEVGEQSR
jgi:hypothetical protein